METKALLYYGSLLFCSVVLGWIGLSGVTADGFTASVSSVLMAIGGVGGVLATLYETVLSSDPTENVPGDRTVWATVGMATLAVLGLLWTTVV